jgi:RNA polymerase sigma-70 factor, ECF subfamily
VSRDSGNNAAWALRLTEQVRQNGRLFYRIAYRILRDSVSAEDVCQKAFGKAWEWRETIGDVESLRGWLAKVVVNESLALLRHRKVEERAMAGRSELERSKRLETDDGMELRQSVIAAIDRLPETTRLIVVLRVMQAMSGNDVKDMLGCSASEVSRQLYAGMEMLREHLSDWKYSAE